MRILLVMLLIALLSLLGGCMMPNQEEQARANEAKLVKEGYVHPEAGDMAPPIRSVDQEGNPFELEQALEQGPVLLYFYPANNTPNTTSHLRQLSKVRKEIEEAGLGIGIYALNQADATETKAYLQSEELSLPVLYDPDLTISEQYGCASSSGETLMQERSVVGINPDGSIAFFDRRFFHRPLSLKRLQDKEHFNMVQEQ
ncbi:MAG: redoxin domain-containing protein [bacterium]